MMSNDRLWDDHVFRQPYEPEPPPRFLHTVINRLGLSRASEEAKINGLRFYLKECPPTAESNLRKSILKSKYAFLLEED